MPIARGKLQNIMKRQLAIKNVLYLLRESEILVSSARWRLSSALNVNPYPQEECITEGIYRAPGIPLTAEKEAQLVKAPVLKARAVKKKTRASVT